MSPRDMGWKRRPSHWMVCLPKPKQGSVVIKSETAPGSSAALAPEDFYLDGPLLVFTEAYHRKRGYCCGSACRHCPYGWSAVPQAGTAVRKAQS